MASFEIDEVILVPQEIPVDMPQIVEANIESLQIVQTRDAKSPTHGLGENFMKKSWVEVDWGELGFLMKMDGVGWSHKLPPKDMGWVIMGDNYFSDDRGWGGVKTNFFYQSNGWVNFGWGDFASLV